MYEEPSAHVPTVKVMKLEEVIVHIHKAQDYRAKYTETQECEDNIDLLVVNVVSKEKRHYFMATYILYKKVLKVTLPISFNVLTCF